MLNLMPLTWPLTTWPAVAAAAAVGTQSLLQLEDVFSIHANIGSLIPQIAR
jgi:hypothetical protein